jgi:hypothetical protein
MNTDFGLDIDGEMLGLKIVCAEAWNRRALGKEQPAGKEKP